MPKKKSAKSNEDNDEEDMCERLQANFPDVGPDEAKVIMEIAEEQEFEGNEPHEVNFRGDMMVVAWGRQMPRQVEYTWMPSDQAAEDFAQEQLMSDEGECFWRDAVAAQRTTKGFKDWVDEVIRMDGWQSQLCTYDGNSYETSDGGVYWRSN